MDGEVEVSGERLTWWTFAGHLMSIAAAGLQRWGCDWPMAARDLSRDLSR